MSEIDNIEELPEGVFSINLKIIDQYQFKYLSIMAKYNTSKYKTGYFRGEMIIYFNLITYEYNTVIPLKLQSCVLHWYYTYLIHPGMNIT